MKLTHTIHTFKHDYTPYRSVSRHLGSHCTQVYSRATWTSNTVFIWLWRIHTYVHMTHYKQVYSRATWTSSTVFIWRWLIHTCWHMTHYAQVYVRATWASSAVFIWRWLIQTFLHMTQYAQVCWQGTKASSTVLIWSWFIHTHFDSLCTGLLTGNLSIQYRQTSWTAAYTHRYRFIRLTMLSWRIHVTWSWLIHTCIRITMRRSVHGPLWHPVPANVVDRRIYTHI